MTLIERVDTQLITQERVGYIVHEYLPIRTSLQNGMQITIEAITKHTLKTISLFSYSQISRE